MLNQFRRVDVGNDNGRPEWFIYLFHRRYWASALRTDHDAIRMHEIGNGEPFPQKFRIADNIEINLSLLIAANSFFHFVASLRCSCRRPLCTPSSRQRSLSPRLPRNSGRPIRQVEVELGRR